MILTTLQKLDERALGSLFQQGERRTLLHPMARVISHSGDGYLQVLFPIFAFLWTTRSVALEYAQLLAVAFACERAVYWCLKNGLKRKRPADLVPGFRSIIQASDQFSFPSGHTSASFCLATATGIVFGGPFIAMYIWACCVGLSRVIVGVHFPGDTLAGGFMGSAIAVGSAHYLGML